MEKTSDSTIEQQVRVTVLDGGMGKELRRIGAPFRQPEWSALALMEAPEFVVAAHRNFIEAGAEVITTNNYAVAPFHLGDDVFDERCEELVGLSGVLAREAAGGSSGEVLGSGVRVAGCMPPLFGSYEPENFDPVRAAPIYKRIAAALVPHVDLWLAETISSCAEVESIVAAIEHAEAVAGAAAKPIWLAFAFPDTDGVDGLHPGAAASVRGSGDRQPDVAIRSGESAVQIAGAIAGAGRGVSAVMVNCTTPEEVRPALSALRVALDDVGLVVATGAYANAFPKEDNPEYRANNVVFERRQDMTADRYADIVADWVSDGATLVGGCCDMYPEHIEALARRFGG